MSKSFGLTGLPSDILTDDREFIRRIAVDPQQTSFEKNFQFGFFDQFLSVPSTQQLVYKVTVARDSILFNRSNEIWTGGRELLVYADVGVTFTGTLAATGNVKAMNRIVSDIYDSHPAPEITFQRAIGTAIFSATSKPIAGSALVTSGATAQKAAEYSASEIRIGWPAGTVLWYVYNPIVTNEATSGHTEIIWEQR